MADLDAAIREELANSQRAEFAYSDWVEAGDYDAASEALRAVLDLAHDWLTARPVMSAGPGVYANKVRHAIAQRLGVSR